MLLPLSYQFYKNLQNLPIAPESLKFYLSFHRNHTQLVTKHQLKLHNMSKKLSSVSQV